MKTLDRNERDRLLDKLTHIIDNLDLESDFPSHLLANHWICQLEALTDLENESEKWHERQNKPSDRSYL
jgi:hypothetical protein